MYTLNENHSRSSSNRNPNDLEENQAKRHNDLMDVLETCKHMDGKYLLNLQVHVVKVMIILYENDDSFVSLRHFFPFFHVPETVLIIQEKDLKNDIKKLAVRKIFFVHTTPFRALPISR